ncbi:MAG: TolC family protein [Myxococcota bacterium]
MSIPISHQPRPAGAEKPTGGRIFAIVGALFLSFGLCIHDAGAQEAERDDLRLTEKQAVQRALEQSDLTRAWGASVTEARARAVSEGAWPNPSVSYTHEQSYEQPDAVGEDFILIEQELPLSGERGLRSDAANADADARRHEVTAEMARAAAEARTVYYAVLHLRQRIEVRTAWLDDMREFENVLARRVDAGESSTYDLERLRQEMAEIAADIEFDRAALAKQQSTLRGILYLSDRDGTVVPTGELMPGEIPGNSALREAVDARPEVAAASSRVEAAEYSKRAASRWWVPGPTVTAGYRGASVAGEHYPGFVAGLSLSLPLFNQSGGERLAAQAKLERAKSRRALLRRKYAAEVIGLAEQTRRLRAAAATYRQQGLDRAERVVEVARSGYDAAEIGMLELLDAYRGLVDARLRALTLAKSAREHEIELRRNLGQPNPDVQRPSERSDE